MFWKLRIRPGEDERKVYAEAEEYGIICKIQDLQGIAERLDKYMKKTKVRGAGLTKYIGRSHLVGGGEKWYESVCRPGGNAEKTRGVFSRAV